MKEIPSANVVGNQAILQIVHQFIVPRSELSKEIIEYNLKRRSIIECYPIRIFINLLYRLKRKNIYIYILIYVYICNENKIKY